MKSQWVTWKNSANSAAGLFQTIMGGRMTAVSKPAIWSGPAEQRGGDGKFKGPHPGSLIKCETSQRTDHLSDVSYFSDTLCLIFGLFSTKSPASLLIYIFSSRGNQPASVLQPRTLFPLQTFKGDGRMTFPSLFSFRGLLSLTHWKWHQLSL